MTSNPTYPPEPYRLTVDDWRVLDHQRGLLEIIDGELLMAPSPSIVHQRISRELEFRIYEALRVSKAGEIFNAPTGVRLADDTVLEPDLLVVLAENSDRIKEFYIDGPPDLVVEILSPGTAGRDLGVKRRHYESAGVSEYWIIDPQTQTVEVLTHDSGHYARAGVYRCTETLRSPLLSELAIDLSEIWSAV